ncbi:two-component system, chemotaxis family, CheB/CheR fusion protein [Mucilaginibacter lappiensis]|uniref:histidine kinase n=1 Tax=Mucilaginibacter lappiensis TaxID=354630 RepID=A0ABR6PTE1_9SPHI|nr:chemotaxis protein CheB [Mucilaginibacter lappiensis]MBB6113052.1 two-component system CheB/CheR fusion protein [Mucilaginibacter lappiensis]SIS10944.1 two-component system, chemotaxis family, CheB/CheR fusion protein [Mucilaginibacter lappiensis]
MLKADPLYIIAIGASAGGMEEINSFFDHTPLDGVSYIIIQHLSSDFKSRMVELLAKHSKLVVNEAKDKMKVMSNQVYLIPNDKFMTIRDGKLYMSDKESVKGPHLTINTFFKSLADDYGKKVIGVVLSGLGSDGSDGIKAIKKAGGMVIARNPETTEFGSMPSNAIATGLVDFVLEPASMPDAIEDYVKQGGELIADDKDDELHIKSIINLIKDRSPLDFSDYKLPTLMRRTKRRAACGNFNSLSGYLDFLKATPAEVEALIKDFLISVTSFFRDKEAFTYIQKHILPLVLAGLAADQELKMWVAGCATGEEAYSLGILIAEQLTGKHKDTVVKIFATDIDSAALEHAGRGVYNQEIKKSVSAERLEKYFISEGEYFRVKPEVRSMIIFAQHDLVKNPPYCNIHFISCRNLLIYMTPILQKKIFSMMLFGLKRDGYLFLGSSENPIPIMKNLEVVNKKWKIYKNLKAKRDVSFDVFSLPELLDIKRTPVIAHEIISQSYGNTVSEAMQVSLAGEQDYLAICIDEHNRVVKTYGDTKKYLVQQNFTSNLVELLSKPLAVAFNTLIKRIGQTKELVSVSGIKIKHEQTIVKVKLSISPLKVNKDEQKLMMVTFNPDTSPVSDDIVFNEKIYHDQYTLNLEEELKELKVKLHTAYERLDASNENMQSFNEELISANEEMQSTNEEMQSVNEELHTINADYQLKNKELLEINDDLNNYFRSNINGQLFINNELLLMKFSPGTVKQINLLETDIGRPLSNISTNIKFETIIEDIKQVLSEGIVITKEIETNNGKWYQIMTMPYVQQTDQKRNGAIVTFNDITELKSTQLELDKKNASLTRINSDLDNFVYTASHELLGPLANIETSIGVMNLIKVADPGMLKFLAIINSSVKKFRTLIRDISVIARLEGDMLNMEMIDMEDVIRNIEWNLENRIKSSGAVITQNLEVKQILFSKKNLRSILFNLVSNGIKFNDSKTPLIHIDIAKNKEHIILSVQDNGKGIAKNEMDIIFDMYGRLHKEVDGQGIGLYLAKKIIHAASGNITVESELGKGSKFVIYLKTEAPKDKGAVSA